MQIVTFESTRRPTISLALGPRNHQFPAGAAAGRAQGQAELTNLCKKLGTEEHLAAIALLARDAEVEIPARAPRQYSPMTSDALRAAEQGGMEFGLTL